MANIAVCDHCVMPKPFKAYRVILEDNTPETDSSHPNERMIEQWLGDLCPVCLEALKKGIARHMGPKRSQPRKNKDK